MRPSLQSRSGVGARWLRSPWTSAPLSDGRIGSLEVTRASSQALGKIDFKDSFRFEQRQHHSWIAQAPLLRSRRISLPGQVLR